MSRKVTKKDFKLGLIFSTLTSLVLFFAFFLIDELRESTAFIVILILNTFSSVVTSILNYRELYK